MKVFLVSTPIGEQKLGEMFEKLYEELEKLGYQHISDFITLSSEEFTKEMSKGKDAQKEFYNKMVNNIRQADICIFEASTPSFGVGYLIQESLSNSKPTIVLFYKEMKSFFIPGIDDDKLIVKTYDESSYKKVLKSVVNIAREKRDKRFNFFLSPKLLNYLEQASNARGVTKSKLLRDMIVQHMRENASAE